MTKRYLFLFVIVVVIFSSISAINAMDNGGFDCNVEVMPEDEGVSLLSDTSGINNEEDMSNSEEIPVFSSLSSNRSANVVAPDIVKYHKNGTDFEAKLTDSNGIGIANQFLTFDIVGVKAYTVRTNVDGVASLPINLRVGTYTINVIFDGMNYMTLAVI